MIVFNSSSEMTDWAKRQARLGRKIALVPTMGFFHRGHLDLMQTAGRHADEVVVSLFVNPIQFGVNEDLDSYPRDFQRDADLAQQEGVSVLFAPDVDDMYPEGFQTTVSVSSLSRHLCGADRPGHFNGVTTVVSKLFNIVRPDYAVFGQKDFQQLAVIQRMVKDLNMGVEIVAHPIVREKDGLAMSSRNTYLKPEQRKTALSLSRAIAMAQSLFNDGEGQTTVLKREVIKEILSFPGTSIDYVEFVNQNTLEPMSIADNRTLLVMAVTIDNHIRLIDNGQLALISC